MKLSVAMNNLSKFFVEEEKRADIPAEVFRDDDGKVTEIRVYNVDYEEMIIIDAVGKVSAISIEEFEDFNKRK